MPDCGRMKNLPLSAPLTDTLDVFEETFGPLTQALRPDVLDENVVHLHHRHVGGHFTLTHLGQRMIVADFHEPYPETARTQAPLNALMNRAERFVSVPVSQVSMHRLLAEGFPELSRVRISNRTGLKRYEMRFEVPAGTLLLAGRFVGTQFSLGGTVFTGDPKQDPASDTFVGLARVEYTQPETELAFTVKLAQLRQAAGY